MSDESKVLLKLTEVRRSYASGGTQTEVLHGISLTIQAGEMAAIIGPSGSGKSTLMNIIGCLDKPTSGSYEVSGRNTADLNPDELADLRRSCFGFIFQRYHLLGHLSASENVQVPAVYAGCGEKSRKARAAQLLARLGLGARIDYQPAQLSGGQQQRVSIARALMNGGQIILADEPTGALDSRSGAEVMKILTELNAAGHTVILVTHDAHIAACAKRIITISDGQIVSDKANTPVLPAAAADPETQPVLVSKLQAGPKVSLRAQFDRFKSAFIMAKRAMLSNRLRTLLTMLGIIIGIAAVVSVVALGRGASEKVVSRIAAMGTNTISVYSGTRMGDVRSGRVRSLTARDVAALKGQPYVDAVSATVQTTALLRRGNAEADGSVQGVTSDMFRVYGLELAQGRIFSDEETAHRGPVCVIDDNTYQQFFKGTNPIGQRLLINAMPASIIGVLKPADVPFMRTGQLYVYMPYTSVSSRLMNQDYLSSIVVRIKDGFSTPVAEESLSRLLTGRHKRKDFFIQSSDTIMKSIEETTLTFTLLIGAIAVISLIVGGIGVMNIMLVSVTERTREIGIRMAVGARQSDIMAQFLIEAVTVCLIGGFIGVIASFGIGALLSWIGIGINMSFSLFSIIAALGTSTLIGVGFGFMPARSAARKDPIEALSRE